MIEAILAALVLPIIVSFFLSGCSAQRKAGRISSGEIRPDIAIPERESIVPEVKDYAPRHRDTLKVYDTDGSEMLIMRAIKDETSGEMVATEQLRAAVVTARFRNVAERKGKVDIEFQIVVPGQMQDSEWQLRLHPDMFVLGDSLRLEDVVITGEAYRKAQLRGYQQYERFLQRIITDSTALIDVRNLSIWLQRNIPAVYRFRNDTSFVSDEEFKSAFGVSESQAIEHYTDKLALWLNGMRISRKDAVRSRYIKAPILTEGIRLDTVVRTDSGDFIYNYIQPVSTRKGLRKICVVLSGEVYEQDKMISRMSPSDSLVFYVSSVSTLADSTQRYITRIISRRVEANYSADIVFAKGGYAIDESLVGNREALSSVKRNLRSLVNNDTFDIDSITIASYASPEGLFHTNATLSLRRSRAASDFFSGYLSFLRDSIAREDGFFISMADGRDDGRVTSSARASSPIPFISKSGGENWLGLDDLVLIDTLMFQDEKDDYFVFRNAGLSPDEMEKAISGKRYYGHLRNDCYPSLRKVRFDFALHRKGMVKDTVHTTVPDSVYASGVKALKDRDYEKAVTILRPYHDFNTAVAYVALEYNNSALAILSECRSNAAVDYLLAIVYSRLGDEESAVSHFIHSCRKDASYVFRGNLDPEISSLIKKYNLSFFDSEQESESY